MSQQSKFDDVKPKNHFEKLPFEMRLSILKYIKTKVDRQRYASLSLDLAIELFNISTYNLIKYESFKNGYKVRIGTTKDFETCVTFENDGENCKIKWNYFSIPKNSKSETLENSNAESASADLFLYYLEKYAKQIEVLCLKNVNVEITNRDLMFEKLKELKLELDNKTLAKFILKRIPEKVNLEIRASGNLSIDNILHIPQVLSTPKLSYFSENMRIEQLRAISRRFDKIDVSIGKIKIEELVKYIDDFRRRDRNRQEAHIIINIFSPKPFNLKEFNLENRSHHSIDQLSSNVFNNETFRSFNGNHRLFMRNYRHDMRVLSQFQLLFFLLTVYCIPRRGNEPWSVVLCKFRGNPFEPRTVRWFEEWITDGNNPDTLESYFSSVSNGIYTVRGSNVTDWLQLPWTRGEVLRMALRDPRLQSEKDKPFALFDKAKQLCISYAEQQGYILHRQKITVINAEQTAVYGKDNGVLLTPKLIFTSVLAHEMIHSMNIGHSYSDRNKKIFTYSATGEYDDRYDLMSTANAHMRPSTYGLSGPGLNGPHLDYLGWLPSNRVLYFGKDDRQSYTLRLSSLSVPHRLTAGWLLVMIPYDRDEPANVYTVEYRTPVGNDAAIRQGAVVIHQIKKDGTSFYSKLITHVHSEYDELTVGTEWVKFLQLDENGDFQYIRVKVERTHTKTNSADVKIVTNFRPERCQRNEIIVDVTERIDLELRGVQKVCMPENYEVVTQYDMDVQYKRDAFFSLRKSYGQNECKNGKEWRKLDAYDYVCVPNTRRAELKESPKPIQMEKPSQKCPEDLLARIAFQGDEACVTQEELEKIETENVQSHLNLKYFAFFNGDDTVNI
ncbi:unnamed protein product [Caenorhabditis angaria]|uniref:Uncharacterized protein n=1 Tax=Caenorhabditis angaria TaxID=860376 RepID=A0A9P1MW00_9PELO|nr:unnamed protein product [Caenorhabditis angaria]